jgi:hypothetical protein
MLDQVNKSVAYWRAEESEALRVAAALRSEGAAMAVLRTAITRAELARAERNRLERVSAHTVH